MLMSVALRCLLAMFTNRSSCILSWKLAILSKFIFFGDPEGVTVPAGTASNASKTKWPPFGKFCRLTIFTGFNRKVTML